LAARNWPDEDSEDLVFAVSEVVSNAAEHAYRHNRSADEPEPLVVVAVTELIDSKCRRAEVVVEDFGSWRSGSPEEGARGHGLRMIATLMESCRVDRDRPGTRVTMISRPVHGRGHRGPRALTAEGGGG
jgi:anti-sigma regulatory factor (Ser/Thr protein kinase)